MHKGCIGLTKSGTRPKLLLAAALMLGLGACNGAGFPPFGDSLSTGDPAKKDASASGAQQQDRSEGPSFAEFRDVPIPANADIDFDNLLVLGAEDGWIGRLALTVGYKMPDMYAFYEREMPRFGWLKITSVRSAISTMTYSRGDRIATVTLSSRTTGGTAIDFTVAPANPLAEKSALIGSPSRSASGSSI
ncbi:hypothetical protein NUH88_04215 [Nisaea acidiphila]|uniref:Uncharacterized protein n=1 Tax=Nisaea acidiphila TaxID=1862145 RepID=A0A9J7AVR7_9PROT|nr:hypothetical protein [Nisaea acidiphila]UUX50898.1 hypothetical protein NUH88_04215 [Nisaea acidiphila]